MSVFFHYWFWLAAVSLLCFLLERAFPWRRAQRALRPQIGQDLFFLVFNGHVLGLAMARVAGALVPWIDARLDALGLPAPGSLRLAADWAPGAQFVAFLVLKDLLEWCVHNLLHRAPFLWEFHKVHHSILDLDWIGNMRFHFMEVVVYKAITYLPLVILGADAGVILAVAVVATLVGHLNHANLPWSYGPLRYVFNSPKMHVWHHDVILRGEHGKNFGIVFSAWDWIFGTAFMPREGAPERLGFEGMESYPRSLAGRFFFPLGRIVAGRARP